MNAEPSRWRRLAVKLAQHAAWVLPGARSPWAEAMRRELDYIGDDPAAVRWALGCILASYRARLVHRPNFRARATWRQVATSGVLMLLIGLALQENAGGQTAPPRPACDEPAARRISPAPDAGIGRIRCRSGCADPLVERSDTPQHDPETCEPISEKSGR